jgi:DNA (cytosine-5)-methyltransferase 1
VPRYGEPHRNGGAGRSHARCPSIGRCRRSCRRSNGASLVAGFLAKHYGGHETPGTQLDLPISTLTTQDHHHLVTSSLVHLRGIGRRSCTGIDRAAAAYGLGRAGRTLQRSARSSSRTTARSEDREPLQATPTIPTKDRFGLVTIDGQDYQLADIGMRMLAPRELYRAQGFPDSYKIDIEFRGKPLSKTAQVRMCGNSVCPDVAAAIVAANVRRAGAGERAP